MLSHRAVTRLGLIAAITSGMVMASSAQAPKPRFDVASVRPSAPTGPGAFRPPRPDVFYRPGTSVAELIQVAYGVTSLQIFGGPDWIRDEWFEINAKAPTNAAGGQIPLMVQSLLEDRFRLSIRRDQREMRFSQLVVASGSGQLGPDLQPCIRPQDPSSLKPIALPPGAMPLTGICRPIASIANAATVILGSLVLDKTGLEGLWNYQLVFAGPRSSSFDPAADIGQPIGVPSFTTVLQEQLGLKIESARGFVGVLIVEAVSKPTEN